MAKKPTTFAPLLSATYEDKYKPRFPVMVSPKLDGIRVIIVDGKPMTRSLKDMVKNLEIQAALTGLPMLDGELIVGNPYDSAVCSKTQSVVMSKVCKDSELQKHWKYHVFDFADPSCRDMPFTRRYDGLKSIVDAVVKQRPDLEDRIVIVPHPVLRNEGQMLGYRDECINLGYEGIMLRDPNGVYKWGRATAKERILTKIKLREDAEAVVVDMHEEMHNENEAFINPLGKMERSSHQENKTGTGRLGGYTCRVFRRDDGYFFHPDLSGRFSGEIVEFYLGATANVTREEREELWKVRDTLLNRDVTFKYQYTLGVEKPRFPVFKIFREKE